MKFEIVNHTESEQEQKIKASLFLNILGNLEIKLNGITIAYIGREINLLALGRTGLDDLKKCGVNFDENGYIEINHA